MFLVGAACPASKVAAPGAAGPVCSANLESASCAAVEFRAADYAFKKLGRRYVYVVREKNSDTGGASTELRKAFVVTEVKRGEIALVAENRLMARAGLSGVFYSASKGIEVGDQLSWPRYTIFPAVTSTLLGAVAIVETVVPMARFSVTVELSFRRDERPEGANRMRIEDRMVFAKGVGIVRREVTALRHGVTNTTTWELAAIEESTKEDER
ncbi:MAG: hypothetical protein HYY84_17720 [Deltaproteobacteria bacterium]|nr:hypothetical protein [Deltaproteobacteria bacterium]